MNTANKKTVALSVVAAVAFAVFVSPETKNAPTQTNISRNENVAPARLSLLPPQDNFTSLNKNMPVARPFTVDLMIFHTPRISDTRLDFLVSVVNQSYMNSHVNMRLRVVAKIPVEYPSNKGNLDAMSDLRFGDGVFENVKMLRKKYGADLVTVIRLFKETPGTECGYSILNGMTGETLFPEDGFSIVNDGDGNSDDFCQDTTLAHELGHNMGLAHDKKNARREGVFPYSYGYCVERVVGDIMSQCRGEVVPFFSSPDIIVNGIPLGVRIGEPNAADSVSSLNAVAAEIANFMPTAE
jgi:hypothetical protein